MSGSVTVDGSVVVQGTVDVSGSVTIHGSVQVDTLHVTSSITLPPVVYGSGMTIYGYITWGDESTIDDRTSPLVASAPDGSGLLGMNTFAPVKYVTVAPYTTITFGAELLSTTAYTCNNSTSSTPSVFSNPFPALLENKTWYVYRYNSLGELLDDGYYMGATNVMQTITGGGGEPL